MVACVPWSFAREKSIVADVKVKFGTSTTCREARMFNLTFVSPGITQQRIVTTIDAGFELSYPGSCLVAIAGAGRPDEDGSCLADFVRQRDLCFEAWTVRLSL